MNGAKNGSGARLVFVCIGTPRIIGDSVGPRVGSMLKKAGVQAYNGA